MAFVNEKKIPDEYLEKYGKLLGAEKLKDCSGWTVDYEKEIFITNWPHGYMDMKSTQFFICYWRKNFIHLETDRDINRDVEPRQINYHTLRFKLPITLEQDRALFLQDLNAALVAFGTSGASTGVKNIVTFNLKEA